MGTFLGTVLIMIGLFHLFARDWVWSWTHFNNRLSGIASERTTTWDKGATFVGGCLVLLGFYIALSTPSVPSTHPNRVANPSRPSGVIGVWNANGSTVTLKANGTYQQVIKRKNGKNEIYTSTWEEGTGGFGQVGGDMPRYALKDFVDINSENIDKPLSQINKTLYLAPKSFFN